MNPNMDFKRSGDISFDEGDEQYHDHPPPPRKRTKGARVCDPAKLAERAARKEARMERNRAAAQASRDRKKQAAVELETRVVQLEAELQRYQSQADPSCTVASSTPAQPQLQSENFLLRQQLAQEQLETRRLLDRIASLETKLNDLTQLVLGPPLPSSETVISLPTAIPGLSDSVVVPKVEPQSSRLVAVENSEVPFVDAPTSLDEIPILPVSESILPVDESLLRTPLEDFLWPAWDDSILAPKVEDLDISVAGPQNELDILSFLDAGALQGSSAITC